MTRHTNQTRELFDLPPPADVEAEKMVLGSILVSKTPDETFATISARLQPRDFHDDANRILFESMIRLRRDSKPIDMKLLHDSLKAGNAQDVSALDLVGGAAYLGSLTASVASPFHGIHYASIVREKADKRRLLDLALMTIQASHNGKPVADIVATLSETLKDFEWRNTVANAPAIMSIGSLVAANPCLHEPVIDGILRRGETMNIIADPKRGKSWMLYAQLLSVATGRPWLDRYHCERGRVLLIDNELHKATLANRIPKVAQAMGIGEGDYRKNFDVLSLRGCLLDLPGIDRILTTVERGEYDLVAFDAFYRGIPVGVSENDNAQIANLYNLIDQVTGRLDCAWENIHHASKGSQAGKSITDVGAGAGSQSRAADAHLILREHQEDNTVVLDGAVRSFPPLQAVALTWNWPLWSVDLGINPKQLAGLLTRGDERQQAKDEEGIETIREALQDGPRTANQLRIGMGAPRVAKLLRSMVKAGTVTSSRTMTKGGETDLFNLVPLESITSSDVVDGVTDGQTG